MQRFLIGMAATMVLTVGSQTAWALPDLVIDQVQNHDTAAQHHNPSMHVTVKNQGPNPARGCRMKWQVLYRGQIVNTGIVMVPPLAAGAASPPLLVPTNPHVHPRTVRLTADAANEVLEANEGNNVREVPIP